MSTSQSIRTRELLVGGDASIQNVFCKNVTVDGPILTSADGTVFVSVLDVCRDGCIFDGHSIGLPGQSVTHWGIGSLVSVTHSKGFDGIYELSQNLTTNHVPTLTLTTSPRYTFSSIPTWAPYGVTSQTAVIRRVAVSHLYTAPDNHLYFGTTSAPGYTSVSYKCLTTSRHHLYASTIDINSMRTLASDLSIVTSPGDVFVEPSEAGTTFKIYNATSTTLRVCSPPPGTYIGDPSTLVIALTARSHTALTSVGGSEWINI